MTFLKYEVLPESKIRYRKIDQEFFRVYIYATFYKTRERRIIYSGQTIL